MKRTVILVGALTVVLVAEIVFVVLPLLLPPQKYETKISESKDKSLLPTKIDSLVYRLYNLTPQETKIIEESTNARY